MLIKAIIPLLVLLVSCAPREAVTRLQAKTSGRDIEYSSVNPAWTVMVFSPDGTRYGPPLNFLPGFPPDPTRYFEPAEGVQCVSIGPAGTSTEYAVKRPLRVGDRFQCLSTSFHVIRCVEDCRAAIVGREVRLVNGRMQRSTIFVDACRGVIAFSGREDMQGGIPFDAMLLRGFVGILAHPAFPNCGRSKPG